MLVLTPEFRAWGGGIRTYYAQLLPALANQGVNVRVLEGSAYAASSSAAPLDHDGISSECLQSPRLHKWEAQFQHLSATPKLRRHLAAAWAMWEQAREGAPFDIVEATDWGLLCVPPILSNSVPVIVQCHGSCGQLADHDPIAGEAADDAILRLIERTSLCMADSVQTLSKANASFWRSELDREISVCPPAWKCAPQAEVTPTSKAGLVVGRVQSWKGPETLCEALRKLGASAPRIDWIGREVPWRRQNVSSIRYLSNSYPDVWGPVITHVGPVSPSDIYERQAKAAFNLIPSHWDVFNLTAIEAMTSGRPTIVSLGAGASDIVTHGVNGFTFKAGDAGDLADVITQVMGLSLKEQKQIGERARESIATALDCGRIARDRAGHFRTILQGHRSAPFRSSHWLHRVCSPENSESQEYAFLDTVPLRKLSAHFRDRIFAKLARRVPNAN